jgi:tetratricopeptide (TPR) repeat protein
VHFLLTSAQMAGDQKTVLETAARLRRVVDADVSTKLFWTQPIHAAPYFASVQYGTPEATLKMAAPDPRLPYVTAMWRYARAMAYADQKNGQGVARELAAMERIRTTGDFTAMTTAGVPGPQLIELAEQVARGRLAYRQGNYGQAGARYQKAVQIEDALPYMEPPFWYFPVRQSLGAALLKAGKPQEAQAAFLGALARHPNSAWALYGLRETQLRQGDTQGARASEAALRRAWLGDWKQLKLDRL